MDLVCFRFFFVVDFALAEATFCFAADEKELEIVSLLEGGRKSISRRTS